MRSLLLTRLLQTLVPLGAAAAALAGTAAPEEPSVLPGAASPARSPTPRPEPPFLARPSLAIRVLRAGPAPYTWSTPGRVAASFITDTPDALEVTAWAETSGPVAGPARVRWEIEPPAGFEVPEDAPLSGPQLTVRLQRPWGNPSGAGEPLVLRVRACLEGSPQIAAEAELRQDLADRLRQEYVDLQRAEVPPRSDLIDAEGFARRFGARYRGVTFTELNWSRQPGRDERYPFILATEALVRAIRRTRSEYGRPLTVSSGFRNPVRQTEVHASVGESHHQYGRAADLYVAPDSAPPSTGREVATEIDWLYLAAAALRGGGAWIEPMPACHVNTTGCHVHVDVRDSPPFRRLVRLNGTVRDAAGTPVPDAELRLAGMPARTNSRGRFSLKHVLTPQETTLAVTAPPLGGAARTVWVDETPGEITVSLPERLPEPAGFPPPLFRPRAAEASALPVMRAAPRYQREAVEAAEAAQAAALRPRGAGPDPAAAALGAAIGGAAAAASAALRRRAANGEASALPPAPPEGPAPRDP